MELKLSAPRLRVLWLVLLLLVPVSASVGPVAQGQEAGSEKREGKQPSVVNSTEIAPVPGLQPPDALPPPGLEGVAGSPLAQAGEHLLRAEVLDALGVRIARRVLVLQSDDPELCTIGRTGRRTLALTLAEARLQATTGSSLAEVQGLGVSGEAVGAVLVRARAAQARLGHLEGLLGTLDDKLRAWSCAVDGSAAPGVYLPPEASRPVQNQVAIFVRTSAPSRVVWVDGVPRAVSGPESWSVLVVDSGLRVLCAAAPEQSSCSPTFEVEASMGRAFDLTE